MCNCSTSLLLTFSPSFFSALIRSSVNSVVNDIISLQSGQNGPFCFWPSTPRCSRCRAASLFHSLLSLSWWSERRAKPGKILPNLRACHQAQGCIRWCPFHRSFLQQQHLSLCFPITFRTGFSISASHYL